MKELLDEMAKWDLMLVLEKVWEGENGVLVGFELER